ncbi:hypothetical protein [Rahnella aceris]|uniref:Uncharacterized protein n=1 Tax=Rahnella sp. (strain Y9602) TaxID=2703885 RepID=A0ABW6CG27_RAHSY
MFDDIQHVYAEVFDGKFANNYKMTMRKIQMDQYANLGGDSGVVSYLITGDSILVEFKGGWKYLYNSVKPGTGTVEQMKELARQGRGLNSFISRMVKGNFASKSR